jgi:hypothetical protein
MLDTFAPVVIMVVLSPKSVFNLFFQRVKVVLDYKKKTNDYFKCVTRRCNYPPGASHYLVLKGLGFLNVCYYNIKTCILKAITTNLN